MAELATIARPYAEAAFKLAREQNALPVWGEMLKFAAAVMKDPAMARAAGLVMPDKAFCAKCHKKGVDDAFMGKAHAHDE